MQARCCDLDAVDPRAGGPALAEGDGAGHGIGGSLEERLHAAVGAVPNRTGEAQTPRLVACGGAEEDALHAPEDPDPPRDHSLCYAAWIRHFDVHLAPTRR